MASTIKEGFTIYDVPDATGVETWLIETFGPSFHDCG